VVIDIAFAGMVYAILAPIPLKKAPVPPIFHIVLTISVNPPALPADVCHLAWTASMGLVTVTEIPQATQDVRRYRKVRLSSESPDVD